MKRCKINKSILTNIISYNNVIGFIIDKLNSYVDGFMFLSIDNKQLILTHYWKAYLNQATCFSIIKYDYYIITLGSEDNFFAYEI